MRILATNDDGILAPGLRHMVEAAKRHGEVKVVAPDRERSACGHSMTMREPLRVSRVDAFAGVEAFQVSGVPTDCVNVGLNLAWPDGCDLILSGINAGPNLGFDITYSGTAAGAMEGVINGVPSIALSMAALDEGPIRFETGAGWLDQNWDLLIAARPGDLGFLNINVPNVEPAGLRGARLASMGRRVYKDRLERREDPWGRSYYWQGGVVVAKANHVRGTDVEAVLQGFVSVTPVTMDWTDREAMKVLARTITGFEPE